MYETDIKVEELELSEELKSLPMLGKYDEALKMLLSQIFAGEVILAPYDRAFTLFVTQSGGDLKFPFISIFPNQGYTMSTHNFSATHIGNKIRGSAIIVDDDTLAPVSTSDSMQEFHQYIYFDIPYQIDCWHVNRTQALQLVQELLFWIKAQGQVKVKYKDKEFYSNLAVGDSITDNSSYVEYEDIGNLYRFTISITVNAPVFRTQNHLQVKDAEFELEIKG